MFSIFAQTHDPKICNTEIETINNINHIIMKVVHYSNQEEYHSPVCSVFCMEVSGLLCGSPVSIGFDSPVGDDEDCTKDDFWK